MMTNLLTFASVAKKTTQLLSTVARLRLLLVMLLTLTASTAWAETETLSWKTYTSSGTEASLTITWTGNTSCQVTQSKGDNTSNDVNLSYAASPRWYQYHHVKFTPNTGCTITKVVLTGSESKYNGQDITFVEGTGTITTSSNVTTITGSWSSAFTLKMGKQFRTGSVVVTYETAAASCTSITPSLSYAPSSLSVGGTANPTLSGNIGNGIVTYTSSSTSVATVNASTGVVTAKAAGETTITANIAANNGYCEGTATANVTVTADPYTVTLEAGSGSVTDTELTETSAGAGVTLPPATIDCGDVAWTFAGWATASVGTETTTEPTLIAAGAYSPTSDITLYAVYQRTETTEGTPTTTNKNYTHTIAAKTWSANGAQTLNSISWELSNDGGYYGYDGTKGQQVGSSGSPAKSMTLTTSGFASATKITAIKISTSGASSVAAKVSVKVGSTSYTCNSSTDPITISATNTQYTFTGNSTGDITISWTQTSSKALYFKTIEVDYQITSTSGTTSTTYYHSTPECSTETLVSVLPKIVNFWQSIFGVSLGYLRDKTRYRHVLGGIVVVSLHHRCTKIDFHHINMSRTAFVGLCLFVWQTTERFFV